MIKNQQRSRLANAVAGVTVVATLVQPSGAQITIDIPVTAKLSAMDGAEDDKYGQSVSLYDGFVVIGAPLADHGGMEDAGAVYVYEYDPGTQSWDNEVKLTAGEDAQDFEHFGHSVAIDEDLIIVGAPWRDSWHGAAYVFRYNGQQWVRDQQILDPSDGGTTPFFGGAVDIFKGDTEDVAIVGGEWAERIGAPGSSNGFAVEFRFDGSWSEATTFWNPDYVMTTSEYGKSVSIDGDLMIVGTWEDEDGGSAFAYRFQDPDWVLDGSFNYDLGNTKYGFSVAVSGDVVVIGGERSQAVFGHHYADSIWRDENYIVAHDDNQPLDEKFGYAVSVDTGRVVIGSPNDDDNGSGSGSAYCFAYCGLDEHEIYKLLAEDGVANDGFGTAVAVSGDFAIIGAPFDDDNGTDSGSVYIFDYTATGLSDTDGDGVPDSVDNCPAHYNPCQIDCDDDGEGDVCALADGLSEDCNENEIPDECDILDGFSEDCNENWIPDECELADNPGLDCNFNGRIDECESLFEELTDVHVIFVVDTSSSMEDEHEDGHNFCADVASFETILADALAIGDIDLRVDLRGISNTNYFNCLDEDTVEDVYDESVPWCAGGIPDQESWGPATAVVAEGETGAGSAWDGQVRVVVPLNDEPPYKGDYGLCDAEPDNIHWESIQCAIATANANVVHICPLLGRGPSDSCIEELMDLLASGTGGERFATDYVDPPATWPTDLAAAIVDIVNIALVERADCNQNGIPDTCDVDLSDPDENNEISCDRNDNNIPDECEGLMDCPWDVDGSLEVDIDDLFLVLGNWGPCEDCPEDVNCSGEVDIDDVFAVLGNWGPCPDGNGVGARRGSSTASCNTPATLRRWPRASRQ